MRNLLAVATLSFAATFAHAQVKGSSPAPLATSIATHPSWPAAKNPADVDTTDHIVATIYDVISGPAGQARDWDRFRSLFLPDGHLSVIRPATPAADGKPATNGDVAFLTPDAYVARQGPAFSSNGFFERGIAQRTEEFGNLAMVWTTYESRHNADDAKPFARGINCLTLAHAQGRYWIVNITWDAERSGLTIPEKYLSK